MIQYSKDLEKINQERTKYNDEDNRIYEMFKQDALKDVGLHNHPKADKIFSYAWEKGHSGGYNDVWCVLCDISELFR